MAAVGCLEKEIQFQKEAIEEQDVRQAKDRLPTKNIYLRLKTSFVPSKTSRPGNRLEYPPVIRTCPEPVRSPGIRASVASRMSLPPRKPKTGTCHPHRSKSFTGEGARGRETLFQKRPPPPENTRPPPPKTMLQLPRPPPRRHLPKRARPGGRRPRKDQASATARAGAP